MFHQRRARPPDVGATPGTNVTVALTGVAAAATIGILSVLGPVVAFIQHSIYV